MNDRHESRNSLAILPTVTCDGCGSCCMHMGYPPFAGMYDGGDPDWLALRRSHPDLAAEVRQGAIDGRGDAELPCIWLDPVTRQCRHYEHRPEVCREFELGSPECLEHRRRRGIEQNLQFAG